VSAPENPPAFPRVGEGFGNPLYDTPGMTLRDWFAGQIASGMAAHSGTAGASYGPGDIAARSYEIADAMLSERDG
jgi:hypothetical protein